MPDSSAAPLAPAANIVAPALDAKTAAARAALPPDLQAIFDKATGGAPAAPAPAAPVLTVVPVPDPAPAVQTSPIPAVAQASVAPPADPAPAVDSIDSVTSVNSVGADQTQKADAGKSDPRLVEVDLAAAIAVVNRVLDYGVAKYGHRCGWKQVDMDRYDAAGRRHRRARDMGQLRDEESDLLHMAHEVTNLLFQLQTYVTEHPGEDFLTFKDPPARA